MKLLKDMETSIDFDEIPAFLSKLEPAEPIVFDINSALATEQTNKLNLLLDSFLDVFQQPQIINIDEGKEQF
jgi:hypothetical protein